ncbi:MAG TPA: sulfite oxidase [Beijerinckiaceae bacterium]|jgi:DMSO/TMAO reductase YedYZ molybdopterin-dependent catalytic subunit
MPLQAERELLRREKPGLRVLDDEALNAEAPVDLLGGRLTPVPAFFVRNNGRLPPIAADAAERWTLTVDGEVDRPRAWTLPELKRAFPVVSLTAVLECAGNGRAGFAEPTEGLPWTLGAVGCARWTGVRLADVLRAAGVRPGAVYTGHFSPDESADSPGRPAISRGLPIEKALAPETLLAFAMNDEPLPYLHGGPLRVVAPGFPGSAWQKWLTRIALRDREHDGEKMTGTNYRLPAAPVRPGDAVDPARFSVIADMPVKSLITSPAEGFEAVAGGSVEVCGVAWSGHVPLASVAVSVDGGATWREAALEEAEPFAWRRFTARLPVPGPGAVAVMARAANAAGRAQPLDGAPWNPRGYCNNAVHRVAGRVVLP